MDDANPADPIKLVFLGDFPAAEDGIDPLVTVKGVATIEFLDAAGNLVNPAVTGVAPAAFRFRLLGEVVIGMIGRNVSGELVASRPSADYGHELYQYYQSIVDARRCCMCRGDLDFVGSAHRRFESIDCPTADDTGAVTRIIGVMDYID